jgi:hypothetical protein
MLSIALSVLVAGCERSATSTGGGATPVMKQFGGDWRFDLERSLAEWKAQGVPLEEIDDVRDLAKRMAIHPDMTIDGGKATLRGRPQGEYHFFALHPHGNWACGKAWHHEDRHDPGDMSKCLARLEIREDGLLYLSLRHHDDPADENDPDVRTMPPLAGSATTCTADAQSDPPWSVWHTYVFAPAGK